MKKLFWTLMALAAGTCAQVVHAQVTSVTNVTAPTCASSGSQISVTFTVNSAPNFATIYYDVYFSSSSVTVASGVWSSSMGATITCPTGTTTEHYSFFNLGHTSNTIVQSVTVPSSGYVGYIIVAAVEALPSIPCSSPQGHTGFFYPCSSTTPTSTPTFTATLTPTATTTSTATKTATSTTTSTTTNTATSTATNTTTTTATNTATKTATSTATSTATATITQTPTKTATFTITQTPTNTATLTPTFTPSSTKTNTPTYTFTITNTPTITLTPTQSYTPGPADLNKELTQLNVLAAIHGLVPGGGTPVTPNPTQVPAMVATMQAQLYAIQTAQIPTSTFTPSPTGSPTGTPTITPTPNQNGFMSMSVTLACDMLATSAVVTLNGNYKYYTVIIPGWSSAGAMFSTSSTPTFSFGFSNDGTIFPNGPTMSSGNIPNNANGRYESSTTQIWQSNYAHFSFPGATPTTTAVATVVIRAYN